MTQVTILLFAEAGTLLSSFHRFCGLSKVFDKFDHFRKPCISFDCFFLVFCRSHSYYQVSQIQTLGPGRICEEIKQSRCTEEGGHSGACGAQGQGPHLKREAACHLQFLRNKAQCHLGNSEFPSQAIHLESMWNLPMLNVDDLFNIFVRSSVWTKQTVFLCYQCVTTSALNIRISTWSFLINPILCIVASSPSSLE